MNNPSQPLLPQPSLPCATATRAPSPATTSATTSAITGHPSLRPREILTFRVDSTLSRAEEKDCIQQAHLILTGIQGNIPARRLLCLLSTLSPIHFETAMCLSGFWPKRFRQVYNSLRACGAILPKADVLDGAQMETLLTGLERDCDPELGATDLDNFVESKVRAFCGEIVNPSVVALLCQEVSPS